MLKRHENHGDCGSPLIAISVPQGETAVLKHFPRSTSLIRNATIRKNSIFGLRGVGRPFFGRRACRVFASMSSRADVYRQRAAAAKMRASQAKDLSVKKAFEEVARGWLVLAEQMEWMDRQRSTDEENDRSLC